MSSLNIKYKKRQKCWKIAEILLGLLKPKCNHISIIQILFSMLIIFIANKMKRKEMIRFNEKKIKSLKLRLKHYSYLMEIKNNPNKVKLFKPYYFGVESVKGKIKYLIGIARKNYGYRNVFKEHDNQYLILVKQEINGFLIEVTPFSVLEDVLNQYKQYHGSNSSQTT